MHNKEFKVQIIVSTGDDIKGREYTFSLPFEDDAKFNSGCLLDFIEKALDKELENKFFIEKKPNDASLQKNPL
jgi:hypothetical protein